MDMKIETCLRCNEVFPINPNSPWHSHICPECEKEKTEKQKKEGTYVNLFPKKKSKSLKVGRPREVRKSRVTYLGTMNCPKCGKDGSLIARFRRTKKSWFFVGYHFLHRKGKRTECFVGRIL